MQKLNLEKDIQDFYLPQEVGTPMNDTMRVNNRINDAHNGTNPLSNSHTGNGVIIGLLTQALTLHMMTLNILMGQPESFLFGIKT